MTCPTALGARPCARLGVRAGRAQQRLAPAGVFFHPPKAQYNLGVLYDNGQGVPQDYVQAHMWYNLSAAGSLPSEDRDSAAENGDIVAELMTREQIAEAPGLGFP